MDIRTQEEEMSWGTSADVLRDNVRAWFEELFVALFKQLETKMSAVARSLVKDHDLARDMVGEALCRAFAHVRQFDNDKLFDWCCGLIGRDGEYGTAWLLTITRNVCWDYLRKKREESLELLEYEIMVDSSSNPELQVLDDEERREKTFIAMVALMRLSQADRQILAYSLSYRTMEKIASLMGVSRNTAYQKVSRVRKRFQKHYHDFRREYRFVEVFEGFKGLLLDCVAFDQDEISFLFKPEEEVKNGHISFIDHNDPPTRIRLRKTTFFTWKPSDWTP